MKSFIVVFPVVMFAAGCAASDQESEIPHQSQRSVTVSHDPSGQPFMEVNGGKIGVELSGYNPQKHSQLVETIYKDENGSSLSDIDFVTPSTEQQ